MKCLLILIFVFFTGCGVPEESDHVSTESGNLILSASHGGGGSAWGFAGCESCHPMSVIHEGAENVRQMVKEKGFKTCMGCHGDNGTGKKRPCVICHNMPDMPYQSGGHSHNFVSGASERLTDGECLVCHDASDMNGVFNLERDLTLFGDVQGVLFPYQSETDFCLRCHNRDHQQAGFEMSGLSFDDPLVAMEDNYSHTDYHGFLNSSGMGTYAGLRDGYRYGSVVKCSDCHSLHGTDNEALIIDNSVDGAGSLDPDLRDGSYTVDTAGGDFSQLCVLCHNMETIIDSGDVDTGNGLSGVHEVGIDCRPCHTHGEAVQSGL
ncbi:MAG: hypothetical protein IME96_03170 [Proteobacteria bacterium]|nr:hypothetical protein [Pseudomonadota bacterium]